MFMLGMEFMNLITSFVASVYYLYWQNDAYPYFISCGLSETLYICDEGTDYKNISCYGCQDFRLWLSSFHPSQSLTPVTSQDLTAVS